MTEMPNNTPEPRKRGSRKAQPDSSGACAGKSQASAQSPAKTDSKISKVVGMLSREQGATLEEMIAATGWQAHTTRAALTGLKKKGHGIERTQRNDVSCYRIKAAA